MWIHASYSAGTVSMWGAKLQRKTEISFKMTFWKTKPLYFVKGNCLSFLKVYYFVVFQYGLVEAEPSIAHKSGVSMLSLVQNGS